MQWRQTSIMTGTERIEVIHGPLHLELAQSTGALVSLVDDRTGLAVSLPETAPLEWEAGGQDERHAPERLPRYARTARRGADLRLTGHAVIRGATSTHLQLTARAEEWELRSTYIFDAATTRVGYRFTLLYNGPEEALLRQAHLSLLLGGLSGGDWQVEIPGGPLPPALPLDGTAGEALVSDLATSISHIGLLGIHRPTTAGGLMTWAFSPDYPLYTSIRRAPGGPRVDHRIGLAARLATGQGVSWGGLWIEPFAGSWMEALDAYRAWWASVGVATPTDAHDWGQTAAYYEAHVGAALFKNGFSYAPFPRARDLRDHLGAIKALGFEVIQLMPRHPFPSYAVHDYRDVTRSWGDEDDLREMVTAAHSQGMRVILDFLLHGVVDRQMVERTLHSIETHGLADNDFINRLAQYVRDFAPSWLSEGVDRHPLVAEHPDWFIKDDAGDIAHIYTHALDLANPAVQDYVVAALIWLVENLDVDGFRFDAPTWNEFPNWDPTLPYPAGTAVLGAVSLFRRARAALSQVRPDLLFYTEPSGPLFRQSMDVTYNYDEHWLIGAVLGPGREHAPDHLTARHTLTAWQLAEWFAQRQAALPPGSVTVHHIDSHDSFWWPDPGRKWRREQYGPAAAGALIATFGLIEGGFMNYAGGEEGQEAMLRRVLALRRTLPELGRGGCDYRAVSADDPMLFTPLRSYGALHSVVAVHLAGRAMEATLHIPSTLLEAGRLYTVYDALGEEFITSEGRRLLHSGPDLARLRLPFAAFQARLLVLRATHANIV